MGSFGLEEGRGGGIRAPAVSGVVGRFGTGTTHANAVLLVSDGYTVGKGIHLSVNIYKHASLKQMQNHHASTSNLVFVNCYSKH